MHIRKTKRSLLWDSTFKEKQLPNSSKQIKRKKKEKKLSEKGKGSAKRPNLEGNEIISTLPYKLRGINLSFKPSTLYHTGCAPDHAIEKESEAKRATWRSLKLLFYPWSVLTNWTTVELWSRSQILHAVPCQPGGRWSVEYLTAMINGPCSIKGNRRSVDSHLYSR